MQPQSAPGCTPMSSQALGSHASETIGGQAIATSALEESVLTDGLHCLAPGPSLCAAFGASSLLTECEPAAVHTITSDTSVLSNIIILVVFSSWRRDRWVDPTRCDVPRVLSFLQHFFGFRQGSLHVKGACRSYFCISHAN